MADAVRVGGRKATEGVDAGLAGGDPPKLDGAHRRVLLGRGYRCVVVGVHEVVNILEIGKEVKEMGMEYIFGEMEENI